MLQINNTYVYIMLQDLYLAPMVGWTTPLFRLLVQTINPATITFTEMIVVKSIIYGQQYRQLAVLPEEKKVVCQLAGGCHKDFLKLEEYKHLFDRYTEINLNVGCPSQKVQNGQMGACLMKEPQRVAHILDAMSQLDKRVSVKCRLGVDDQSEDDLHKFIESCQPYTKKIYIHARKALLNGINPRQNRSIPPINYDMAINLAKTFNDIDFVINGEIVTREDIKKFSDSPFRGVMIGRSAYKNIWVFDDSSQEGSIIKIQRCSDFFRNIISRQRRDHEWMKVFSTITNGMRGSKAIRRKIADDKSVELDYTINSFLEHVGKCIG